MLAVSSGALCGTCRPCAVQLTGRSPRGETYQAVDHEYAALVDSLQKDLRRLGMVLPSLKRSAETIGTARETDKVRGDVKHLMDEGRDLIQAVSTQLKTRFEDFVSAHGIDRAERNTRKQTQQKFAKDLQERATAFNGVRPSSHCGCSDAS